MNKQVAAEMNLAELTAKIHPPICENGRNSRSWSVSPEGDCRIVTNTLRLLRLAPRMLAVSVGQFARRLKAHNWRTTNGIEAQPAFHAISVALPRRRPGNAFSRPPRMTFSTF